MERRLNRKLSVSFNYQCSHHYVKKQIEVPSVPHDYPEIKVKQRWTIGHKQLCRVQSARAVVWTSSMQFTFSRPSLRPTLIISPPSNLTERRYRVHSKYFSRSVAYRLKSGPAKWLSRLKICRIFSQPLHELHIGTTSYVTTVFFQILFSWIHYGVHINSGRFKTSATNHKTPFTTTTGSG